MANQITDFLSERKGAPDVQAAELRKQDWLSQLNVLYHLVNKWLEEAKVSGTVENFHSGQMEITEERLGAYLVPEISFSVGTVSVRFIPKGTYVIGAGGRVDVHATSGRVATLLVNQGAWLYVDPGTHQHPPLTEQTFLDLLKYLFVS